MPNMILGKEGSWRRKRKVREIGTFVTDRNKNYYAFELLVKNEPGVIFEIGQRFADKKINIVHFVHSDTSEDISTIFVVGDFTDSMVSPQQLLDEFKGEKKHIFEIEFAHKAGNVYYSSYLFPLTLNGHRVVLFGPANMNGLIFGLRKTLGLSMANTLLYHLGHNIGVSTYEYYFKPRNYKPDDIFSVLKLLDAILISYGWGRMRRYQTVKNKLIIDIENLWECDIQKSRGDSQGSYYFKGVLTGFFENLYDEKIEIKETKCISKGDDICRFEISLL